VLTEKGAEKRLFCQLGQTINRKCAAAISGLEQMFDSKALCEPAAMTNQKPSTMTRKYAPLRVRVYFWSVGHVA
jgi:hypothetical protein